MVSVIIPCYNAEIWIMETVDSCLNQQVYLKEIIIVDDHSVDNSWSKIQLLEAKYPEIIKTYKNPRKGANSARNFGFECATGDYIQWLDADDIILPNKFKKQIEILKLEKADICYSDWRMDFYDSNGTKLREEKKQCSHVEDYCAELLKDNWTCNNNYLLTYFAAQLISNHNGWNEETSVGQDREYFTVGALKELKFVYEPGVFSVYKMVNTSSVSKLNFSKRLELNQVLEKRFFNLIQEITYDNRREFYSRIIYTHHIKAIFYNSNIKMTYKFGLSQLVWSMMHWKMKLLIPFVFIKSKFVKVMHK